jgi:hypothetical protein
VDFTGMAHTPWRCVDMETLIEHDLITEDLVRPHIVHPQQADFQQNCEL